MRESNATGTPPDVMAAFLLFLACCLASLFQSDHPVIDSLGAWLLP